MVKYHENTYLVMTTVPGQQAASVFHRLTYKERNQLASDLRHCIMQFRQIPNKNQRLICDTLGGPVFDYRINNNTCGPFDSESEFHKCLVTRDNLRALVEKAHSKTHRIVFTHGDLSPSNIMIENGKLAGIIDFGCSGYLPEYWEYTKAKHDFWGDQKDWAALINSVFHGEQYKEELQAEREMWQYANPF